MTAIGGSQLDEGLACRCTKCSECGISVNDKTLVCLDQKVISEMTLQPVSRTAQTHSAMGVFEQDQIHTLKIQILLKQYKPYKYIFFQQVISVSAQIRHNLKDINTTGAFLFPSPFFFFWCGEVSFGVFLGCFIAQDAPPTQLFLCNKGGKHTMMHFFTSLFLNLSHKEWSAESRKAEDCLGHSFKVKVNNKAFKR